MPHVSRRSRGTFLESRQGDLGQGLAGVDGVSDQPSVGATSCRADVDADLRGADDVEVCHLRADHDAVGLANDRYGLDRYFDMDVVDRRFVGAAERESHALELELLIET